MPKQTFNVRVSVRIKPMNVNLLSAHEQERLASAPKPSADEVNLDFSVPSNKQEIHLIKQEKWVNGKIAVSAGDPNEVLRQFQFQHVLDPGANQVLAYHEIMPDLESKFLDGYDCSLMAYGQTGSGKTHTIFGPPGCLTESSLRLAHDGLGEPADWGILPRTLLSVLRKVDDECTVVATAVELYMNKIYDLLNGRKAVGSGTIGGSGASSVKADQGTKWGYGNNLLYREQPKKKVGFHLTGETEAPLTSATDVAKFCRTVEATRVAHTTKMNDRSSRSHCIVSIILTRARKRGATQSRFMFVDLSGSERIKKSGAEGSRKDEAAETNKSLTVLGRCIRELGTHQSHISYRDSTLTMIMRKSLGGNSQSAVVVTIAEDPAYGDETLSSLQFGERSALVKNRTSRKVLDVSSTLASLEAKREELKRHVDILRAQGKAGGVDESFPPATIVSFLENKRRMEENMAKVNAIKTQMIEKAARGGKGTVAYNNLDAQREYHQSQYQNLHDIVWRASTTGIWQKPSAMFVQREAELAGVEASIARLKKSST